MHNQISCKVNVEVEERVVPLIESLSYFPLLYTVESCEGGEYKDGIE